jgi:hypothetical protein
MISLKKSGIIQSINQLIVNARMYCDIIPTTANSDFLKWIKGIRAELVELIQMIDKMAFTLEDEHK